MANSNPQNLTGRHLVPSLSFKEPACSLLIFTAPLLEEKWYIRTHHLIAKISDPVRIH